MFWKHWHTVFPKPHISPWPYSCLMELAFIEQLHGKARSVSWLWAFCFQVSHHRQATSNGFKLKYEMPFKNWTMRFLKILLYVFHMCLYSYCIYINLSIFLWKCPEEIVKLLEKSLYIVFDIFTSLHSKSKDNNSWFYFLLLLFTIHFKKSEGDKSFSILRLVELK